MHPRVRGELEGSSWNAGSCIPALLPVLWGQNVALDPREGDMEEIWKGEVLKNPKIRVPGAQKSKIQRSYGQSEEEEGRGRKRKGILGAWI